MWIKRVLGLCWLSFEENFWLVLVCIGLEEWL